MTSPRLYIMRAHALLVAAAALLTGCNSSDEPPMVSLGIDDSYVIERMRKLPLTPEFYGEEYRWTLDGRTVSTDHDYIFLAAEEGTYRMGFDIIDPANPYHHDFTVTVVREAVEYTPYIKEVVEYCPAPGQFVNELPPYEPGDTYDDMLRKATDCISGKNDVMISLGGFGGYVTFTFDHTVVNVPGERDLRFWGNAFYELTDSERKGGSAEPGIVMVSYDANCNGLPDDPFYELAGSAYSDPLTRHRYTVTYSRPDPAKAPEPDGGFITDATYIPWADSLGDTGFIPMNSFHSQPYWPQWLPESVTGLSFTGTCLPANAVDRYGDGSYFILYCFDWGYVDNHPNEQTGPNTFDISWAVDSFGLPVNLPGVDFVRVYTAENQYCGWLGETSTELCRAADLHITEGTPLPAIP